MSEHPFRAIWDTRDRQAWSEALAPEIEVHSPILRKTIHGREAVAELYDALFATLGEVRVTDEFANGNLSAFFWRADLEGRWIEGADLVRSNEQGEITEITALVRPLVDIGTFAAAMGPPMARKRGRLRVPVVKALTLPLRGLLVVADLIATRLTTRPG
jgi:hypothetical protein